MQTEISTTWYIWIDEKNKVISMKEVPEWRKRCFNSKPIALEIISKLVSRGYKIG